MQLVARKCLCFSILLILFAGSPARADDIQAARTHYRRGTKLFSLGRFDEAIQEYDAAYEIKDDPSLLYNIAQAHRLNNNLPKALFFYKSYLNRVPNAENATEVSNRINELQRLIDEHAKAQSGAPTQALPSVPLERSEPAAAAPALTAVPAPVAASASAPAAAPERPIYKKGWFWGVVAGGAAVIAAGVALGVVYGSSERAPAASFGIIRGN
jgi:tetratricopeptide (TPR) repeat protein